MKRSHSDVFGQLGALDSRLQKEGVHAAEDQNFDHNAANQGLQAIRHEIDALRSAMSAVQKQNAQPRRVPQVMKRRAQNYWRWKNTLVA
jgi:hypothetical protein